MFVRKKKFGNRTYYYLVESFREGKKVKQRVMKYLGKEKPSKKEIEKIVKSVKLKLKINSQRKS